MHLKALFAEKTNLDLLQGGRPERSSNLTSLGRDGRPASCENELKAWKNERKGNRRLKIFPFSHILKFQHRYTGMGKWEE